MVRGRALEFGPRSVDPDVSGSMRDQRACKKSVATIIYDIYIQIASVYEMSGESTIDTRTVPFRSVRPGVGRVTGWPKFRRRPPWGSTGFQLPKVGTKVLSEVGRKLAIVKHPIVAQSFIRWNL